jgi:hypothetical protein
MRDSTLTNLDMSAYMSKISFGSKVASVMYMNTIRISLEIQHELLQQFDHDLPGRLKTACIKKKIAIVILSRYTL